MNEIKSENSLRFLVASWIFFVIGILWIIFVVYQWWFDTEQSLQPIFWSLFPMAIGGGLRNKALGREELNKSDDTGYMPPTI